MIDVERLLEQIRKGVPVAQVLAAAVAEAPADVDRLWRHAALVRAFDKELYDTVLARGLNAPTFERFVNSPGVDSLPNGESFYVGESARARAFEAWTRDRAGLTVFSSELVAHYLRVGSPVDVFTHRIFADPTAALSDLQRLYLEMDDRFDLAGCDALLLLVRNRLNLLDEGSPIRIELTRREQYLRSRTLFADEYYRTVSYLHRDGLEEAGERFLANPKTWILHVHGKGGTGKTMFVRWLIARRLVKERDGRRMPVAMLDFDRLDLAAFARSPWLILPAIAEQLDQQLEVGTFKSLLDQTSDFVPMLRRAARDSISSAQRNRLASEGRRVGAEAEPSFISKLGAIPVVVVLDTLEEPLLHYKTAIRRVVELFERIHKECAGFRVVLSGRYSIAESNRLPATAQRLKPFMEDAPVEDFTLEESTRYLRVVRRVDKSEDVLALVHKHTRGNPLELSLFAELLHADPSLVTPAQIRKVYPIARFARLLERIIKRIPDSQEVVRWLLRYAVVPRELTRRYFDEVLSRYMPREVSGDRPLDKPNRFTGELAPRYGKQRFWTHTARRSTNDRVWKQLEQYAASASWVTAAQGVLYLQPELTNPMRDLLQEQSWPMFRTLHRASATYFARLARQEPDRWADHIIETIYHRFQLKGKKAVPYFRRRLADRRAKDPAVRERLAALVLESEFLDPDTFEPRPYRRRGTIVDRETCAWAAFEVCVAAITQRLRLPNKHPDADEMIERMAEYSESLEALSRGGRPPTIPANWRRLVAGAVAIYANQPKKGARLVRAAIAREPRSDLRLLGELLLVVPLQWSAAADDRFFRTARRLAVRTRSAQFPAWWIDYCRGQRHLVRSQFVTAARSLDDAARKMAVLRPHPPDIGDCVRRTVQAYLATGEHTKARHLLEAIRASAKRRRNRDLETQYLISSTQLALAQFDVARAEKDLSQLRKHEGVHRGILAELEGDLAALLFETHEMETRYLTATQVYLSTSLRGQMNCHLKRARYYLEALEHAPTARSFLSQTIQSQDPWSPLEYFVLTARLSALAGDAMPLQPQSIKTLAQTAHVRAAVLSTGRSSRRQIEAFLTALAAVPRGPARAESLREFSAVASRRVVRDHRAARRLAHLVPLVPTRKEFPVQAYHLAAALQFFGDDETARSLLSAGVGRAGHAFLREKLLRARAIVDGRPIPTVESVFPASMKWRGIRATLLIEEAERRVSGNVDGAAEILDRIEPDIAALSIDSVWRLRADELRGRIAQRESNEAAAIARYQTALACAERSENRAAATRLRKRLSDLERRANPRALKVELQPPGITVRVQLAKNGIAISTDWPDGARDERAIDGGSERRLSSLVTALRSGAATSSELVSLLRNSGKGTIGAVRAVLGNADPTIDVAIRTSGRSIAAFPWELAFKPSAVVYRAHPDDTGREMIMWVQRALRTLGFPLIVDGVLGAKTQRALQEYLPEEIVPYPRALKAALRSRLDQLPDRHGRILVLRAGLERERRLRRGHGLVGLDIVKDYLSTARRPEVTVVENSRISQLETVLLKARPTLIHIVTGFSESSTTREIHLDVAQQPSVASDEWMPGGTEHDVPLTASYLKLLLERLLGNGSPPFLIIEATAPSDDYERARQVLLRNAFCADLFAFGRTRGVLATGLFEQQTLLGAYKEFVPLVSRNPSAADLHKTFWRAAGGTFPPALFTVDPDLPTLI